MNFFELLTIRNKKKIDEHETALGEKANQSSVTASLALKADKTYTDNLVASINASPKGVYTDLAAVTTAFPTGNANIYITSGNGHWCYWNGSAWTDGGTYQSTGISEGSITLKQTAFRFVTKNLVHNSQESWVQGKVYDGTGTTTNITSDKLYIPVDTDYKLAVITNTIGGIGAYYLDLYDASNVKLDTLTITVASTPNVNISSTTYSTYSYARLRVYRSATITISVLPSQLTLLLQVANGDYSYVDRYEPFADSSVTKNKIANDAVTKEKINSDVRQSMYDTTKEMNFIRTGSNIFDSSLIVDGYMWGSDSDALIDYRTSDSAYFISDYIKVEPSTTYSINDGVPRLVAYDSNKNALSTITKTTVIEGSHYTFTTPSDCYYVRFTRVKVNASSISYKNVMLYKGSTKRINGMVYRYGFKNPLPNEKWYFNRKTCSFGDSLTENNRYQPILANQYGFFDTNIGIGGTTVGGSNANAMWQDVRVNAIPTDTEILFFMGGTNDWSQNIPIGAISDTGTSTFYGAYQTMLNKIYARVPNVMVVLMDIPYRSDYGTVNTNNNTLQDFRDAIKNISIKYGYPLVDTTRIGINANNHTTYLADGVHHNILGASKIVSAIIGKLKEIEPVNVLILSVSSLTLSVGATYTILTNRSVTWVSSATSVATVSSEGLVTAVAAGTAKITATDSEGNVVTIPITVS